MNYRVIDKETYYRKGVFEHFTKDCKCSTSMTARVDVTRLVEYSKKTDTKFYINFLYILSKVLNSRDDYKMGYLWETDELICYDTVNPTQYVFHEDTETCTPVYSTYYEDYETFYKNALNDLETNKLDRDYKLDMQTHPNWFDASYISWLSYDSLNIELPDGYLFFPPIVNWGRYREENGKLMMPVSVRLNHAIADGYLLANVYRLLDDEIKEFTHTTLYTDRLILRRWKESDAESLYQYAKDPDVGPIAGWPPHQNVNESRSIIKNVFSSPEAYAICLKEDNKAIGAIELKLYGGNMNDLAQGPDECELGYWLGKPFWGKGIMPEAGRELLRHAFEDVGFTKVWCGYYAGNNKSSRVQDKLGFKYQWTTRDVDVPLMHEKRTGHVNLMTKEDWENMNSGRS